MSDHPREAARHLKRLNLCNDVWYNVFPFVGHTSLGLGLALCNCRFNALVDKYFENAKWALGSIEICRASKGYGMEIQKRRRTVPMAKTPLPPQIVGFKYILISYIDHTVFDFLRRIVRILSPEIAVNIHLKLTEIRVWHAMGLLWPMLSNSISYLTLNSRQLSGLQFATSVTVLNDCANLRGIEFHKEQSFGDMDFDSEYEEDWDEDEDGPDIIEIDPHHHGDHPPHYYDALFGQEMDGIMANLAANYAVGANGHDNLQAGDDQPDIMEVDPAADHQQQQQPEMGALFAWPGSALFQWLHRGREDGQPKLLKYTGHVCVTALDIETFKEAFLSNRSSPISYIIRLETRLEDIEPFELKNDQTGEQLVLRRFFSDLWLLERGPVGRAESECDSDRVGLKCGWEEHRNGMINVAVYSDRDVGPLSPP